MTPTDAKDETPRTDAIVEQLVTNVMHHWVRREDYCDKEQLPRRVQDSFDNYYGAKPTEEIRKLERELLAAQTENERLAWERDEALRERRAQMDKDTKRLHNVTTSLISAEAALSAERAAREAAQKDVARLDALEREVEESPITLHNLPVGEEVGKWRGLGMKPTRRTLRQAIDDLMRNGPAARGSHEA